MKDIVDMTARDIKTRNIELTINVAKDVPAVISSDISKVKQVLMNMLMQGVNNQFRGFIKIEVEYKEMGEYKLPHIIVEIEASKFDLKQKEITRLGKLS
jgi:signal transduction histidine kinase